MTTDAPIDPYTTTTCTVVEPRSGITLAVVPGLPFDHATCIQVRRLGWKALEKATAAKQAEAMRLITGLTESAGSMRAVVADLVANAARKSAAETEAAESAKATAAAEATKAEAPPVAPATGDPMELYSAESLVADGVVAIDGAPATPEALDLLAPEAHALVARAVLRLSRPGAFETEADRGNA